LLASRPKGGVGMKKYEIMFIVKPTLSEEEVKNVVENFSNTLTSNGAKINETKELGQKELAYEIKKFKSGYYFLFEIESENDKATSEFDRLALISSDVIRHLIIRLEK
jgi:small subunit ribosomal protein S6